jgi:hypothetical protein
MTTRVSSSFFPLINVIGFFINIACLRDLGTKIDESVLNIVLLLPPEPLPYGSNILKFALLPGAKTTGVGLFAGKKGAN